MSISESKSVVARQGRLLFGGPANPLEVQSLIEDANASVIHLKQLMQRCKQTTKLQCERIIRQLLSYNRLLNEFLVRGAGTRQAIDRIAWQDGESTFQGRIQTGIIVNLRHLEIQDFLEEAEVLFTTKMLEILKTKNAVKVNTTLEGEYCIIKNHEEVIELKTFHTKNAKIFQTTDLGNWFEEHIRSPLLRKSSEFEERDSGWSLRGIVSLTININKYNPIRGSSYIDLPNYIKNKKACVNVNNNDERCFGWAMLAGLHPVSKHSDRVSNYLKYWNELNFAGMTFPVLPRDVPRFENQNDISVNVYMLKKIKKIFELNPVHVTNEKKVNHVNLLLIQNYYIEENENENDEDKDEENDNEPLKFHYVLIKDLSRLVASRVSKHKGKCFFCDRCLHYFRSAEKLAFHEIDCSKVDACRVTLPTTQNNILKFKNFKNKQRNPLVVYADFECLLKKAEEQVNDNTKVVQIHEPCSVGYYVQCSFNDDLSYYKSYRGENPAKWFSNELVNITKEYQDILNEPKPMEPLTAEEKEVFRKATECHICEKPLTGVRVRDHCHLTGKFRGAAHEDCNLGYQDSRTIDVIFHNMSAYDGHLIITEITTIIEGRTDLIPLNMEKYISFIKHIKDSEVQLRFLDSFRFMSSSLDKLSSYLEEKKIVKREFRNLDERRFQLLTKKGIFPYEYLDSWEKLNVIELPSREDFYNKLNDTAISEEDYHHARTVWQEFNIQSLGEYSDLYLKTDVLLLADVFENFRNQCLKSYDLDPAHYFTTPGLSWDAMLKYTKIELELLTDIDMILFIERGIRGGISQCSNRYARANNEYMSNYNNKEETSYLMYFDVNNLYGWAMTQHLPQGQFEWIENFEENFNWDVPEDSDTGFILEVDLDYPKEIHDVHKDLPFCPELMAPPGSSEKKLLTTLYPKSRYVIHYRALHQALANGLQLIKIHRILQFKQSAWLKSYIDFNSEMRAKAKNEFEKNLYKLMNNAVYGKTMENVRKHVNVKLRTKWKGRYGVEALIASPNFQARSIFKDNLVAIKLRKVQVLLNKPIYIGFSVLDISKTCLYEFHYEFIANIYKEDCKILYVDTDSLIYELRKKNIYHVMKKNLERFDTSDYPLHNQYDLPLVNKKIVGLMKDENCTGPPLWQFVGLRSKMYSVCSEGRDVMKKAKGVKSSVIQKTLDFNDYYECLVNNTTQRRDQFLFRSQKHVIQTIKQNKLALSPFDDKRCVQENCFSTLPWGYYKIMDNIEMETD